jgi:hypothetical protein
MDSNTYSVEPADEHPTGPAGGPKADLEAGLGELAAAVDRLATQDPAMTGWSDAVRAERVLVLRRLVDRLEGVWLRELAGVDARGAAGAEEGREVGSTAGWLRRQLRLGPGAASTSVRTARALFRGPLPTTAKP